MLMLITSKIQISSVLEVHTSGYPGRESLFLMGDAGDGPQARFGKVTSKRRPQSVLTNGTPCEKTKAYYLVLCPCHDVTDQTLILGSF
jgi:hypothetical protein